MSKNMLPRRAFGVTGLQVTPLGIGASDNAEVYRLLLDAGVNLVDTAQCYGEHETFLGATISQRRAEFILVSKCGHHDVLADNSMRSRTISMVDIDQALIRLRTDYLDVMLLHSYDRDLLEMGEAVAVLAAAKRAGKIRFAGYSGDNESAAVAAGLIDLDVLETSISIADQRNIELALPLCRSRGMGVIAKRPTTSGAWRLLSATAEAMDNKKPYVGRLLAMGLRPEKLGLGADSGAWLEMALRFNQAVDGLHTSILATKNPAHAEANLNAAVKGPLPLGMYQTIRDLFQRAEATAGEIWKGEN